MPHLRSGHGIRDPLRRWQLERQTHPQKSSERSACRAKALAEPASRDGRCVPEHDQFHRDRTILSDRQAGAGSVHRAGQEIRRTFLFLNPSLLLLEQN